MDKYNSVLGHLKKINEDTVISCFIPSFSREVNFKPMNVAQQQQLIKNISNEATDNLKIANSINDMLQTNCMEDIDLCVIDREIVLLQYRMHDVSIDENERTKIAEAIEAIKQTNDLNTKKTIEAYGITVNCSAPSLRRDAVINAATIKAIESNNSKKQQDLIPLIYTHQIIKYMNNIHIGEYVFVCFDNPNDLPNLTTIVNNIPVDINNGVISFANSMQTMFKHVLKDKNISLQTPTM